MDRIDLRVNDGIDSSVDFNIDFECILDTKINENKDIFEEKIKYLIQNEQEQELITKNQKREIGEIINIKMNSFNSKNKLLSTRIEIINELRKKLLYLSLTFNKQVVVAISREEYLINQIKDCTNLLADLLLIYNDIIKKSNILITNESLIQSI